MGDLDQGDAKQRVKATGAIPAPPTYSGSPFDASFAEVGAQQEDLSSVQEAGSARSAALPVPMILEELTLAGGDAELPFQVVPGIKAGDYAVYLPEGCLVVDNQDVPVSKFGVGKAPGFSGPWYRYPFTGNLMSGYLNVKVTCSKSGSVTVDEVKFTNGTPQPDDGSGSEDGSQTKIYSVAIIKSMDGLSRIAQVVTSAIRITTEFNPPVDGISVEHDPENDERLQLYKFSGSEADGSPGLVQRITATADDEGNVTLSASDSLMLVCRKENKIVYVPLSKEKDEDSEDGKDPSKESQDEVDEPESENADPATPGAGRLNKGDPGSTGSSSDDCGPGGVSTGGGGGFGGGNNGGYSGCDEC